jgi:prepilin-type N-terminal cleavage/methylation domain-containing protein
VKARNVKEAGFTMIEVLVAMVIFAVFAATMTTTFSAHIRRNYESAVRTGATLAAQQVLDSYRLEDITAIPTSGTASTTRTIGSREFEVDTSFCGNAAFCSTNNRHLTVAVSFRGEDLYEVETVFTQLR